MDISLSEKGRYGVKIMKIYDVIVVGAGDVGLGIALRPPRRT